MEVREGEATAWRWRVDAEAVAVMVVGRRISLLAGCELGRILGVVVPLDWISPAVEETLLVKEEMAQPAQEAASLGWGVLMRGAVAFEESTAVGGGRTVSAIVEACLRIRWRKRSMVLLAWSRMSLSLSIRQGQIAGRIRFAESSSLKVSAVAPSASNAAFRAWTKGSRRERVKAAINTFDLLPTPRFLEIFPKQIVVFVRIPGCSSLEVLARYFNSSPLTVRSDNFPIMVKTALTVCSRTTGATSVNPVT